MTEVSAGLSPRLLPKARNSGQEQVDDAAGESAKVKWKGSVPVGAPNQAAGGDPLAGLRARLRNATQAIR